MEDIRIAQHATVKAEFHRQAADASELIVRANKPGFCATREKLEPYRQAIETVQGQRRRQWAAAKVAADALLRNDRRK